jgi:hypothetical protein
MHRRSPAAAFGTRQLDIDGPPAGRRAGDWQPLSHLLSFRHILSLNGNGPPAAAFRGSLSRAALGSGHAATAVSLHTGQHRAQNQPFRIIGAAGPLDTEPAWCYGLSRRVEATAGMWKGEVWIQIVN